MAWFARPARVGVDAERPVGPLPDATERIDVIGPADLDLEDGISLSASLSFTSIVSQSARPSVKLDQRRVRGIESPTASTRDSPGSLAAQVPERGVEGVPGAAVPGQAPAGALLEALGVPGVGRQERFPGGEAPARAVSAVSP
jgi:hypothetical protein